MIRRLGTNTFKDHLNWAAGSPTATPTQGPLGICKTLPRVTLVYHRWLSTIFWHVCCTHLLPNLVGVPLRNWGKQPLGVTWVLVVGRGTWQALPVAEDPTLPLGTHSLLQLKGPGEPELACWNNVIRVLSLSISQSFQGLLVGPESTASCIVVGTQIKFVEWMNRSEWMVVGSSRIAFSQFSKSSWKST